MRIVLLLSGLAFASVSLAAKVPPATGPESVLDSYYPVASVRLGETGSIIIHFTIGPDGRAVFATGADENEGSPSPRLIAGAERLLHDVHFDLQNSQNRQLTARIVFQLHPCEAKTGPSDTDYNFDVCGQPHCQPQYAQSIQVESGPKAALHAILDRGDLSDIDALSQALHLGLKLRPPKRSDHLVQWEAIATEASEYVDISDFSYTAMTDEKAGKTKIEIRFKPKGPWTVCKWGKEWNQKAVEVGESSIIDGAVNSSFFQTLHWGGEDGISVRTDTFSGGLLTQTIPRIVIFPERLVLTRRADTHLLERVVDALLSGDLRDFHHVGELLQADLDVKEYGASAPGWLYGVLEQPIDGADSAHVVYYLDDFGWGAWGPLSRVPGPEARTVDLTFPVETDLVCLSPHNITEELDKRKARYRIDQNDGANRAYVVSGDNVISLTARVTDSCIQTLALHQITDIRHDVAFPLKFVARDATHVFSERLTAKGRAKIKALLWRLNRRTLCGIDLLLSAAKPPLESSSKLRQRHLAELVKRSLNNGGFPAERIQIVDEGQSDDESEGDPPLFVTVQESALDCSQPRPSRMP